MDGQQCPDAGPFAVCIFPPFPLPRTCRRGDHPKKWVVDRRHRSHDTAQFAHPNPI
jgi:hypothetical protein